MKLLSTLLVFAGYTLVYAAVANHGKYAQMPWIGIFRDAYGVDAAKQKGGASSSGGAPSSSSPRYSSGPEVNPPKQSRPRKMPGVA